MKYNHGTNQNTHYRRQLIEFPLYIYHVITYLLHK